MSMPTFKARPAAICMVLGACGDRGESPPEDSLDAAADGRIECALAGSDIFERSCTTEQIARGNQNILLIRHKDGGFRRFSILTDGRGLAPADGFDPTSIRLIANGMIEVSSGDDQYRLPAQIKSDASAESQMRR